MVGTLNVVISVCIDVDTKGVGYQGGGPFVNSSVLRFFVHFFAVVETD